MAVATDTCVLKGPRGRRSGRENAVARRPVTTCVVCQLSVRDDSQHEAGDVLICAHCLADATQLSESTTAPGQAPAKRTVERTAPPPGAFLVPLRRTDRNSRPL